MFVWKWSEVRLWSFWPPCSSSIIFACMVAQRTINYTTTISSKGEKKFVKVFFKLKSLTPPWAQGRGKGILPYLFYFDKTIQLCNVENNNSVL